MCGQRFPVDGLHLTTRTATSSFPSRLQARIVAIMSKRLACVISARTRSFNRPLQGTVEAGETFIGGKAARSAFAALAHLPTQPCTELADMDLFVVSTIGLDLLYVLVIVRLSADSLSGSTSHRVQLRSGSHTRSRRHSLEMRLRAT